ncbi:hypothetical protein DL95DRAFT_400060 [Leptodontidium sp. 2 PMI_412]|nr:hypothetical protein DL95DRAFT_400060 [Leptodontidium sp. 2 PMI_412]
MTSTFTGFPQLPIEIRLRIWHCTLQLFIRVIEVDPGDNQHSPGTPLTVTLTPDSPPTLLKINRECRSEFLHLYQIPFFHQWTQDSNYNKLLVNFSSDILYLKLRSINVPLSPLPRARIKPLFRKLFFNHADEVTGQLESLAGNNAFWDTYEDVTLWPQPFLREFVKLREMARVSNSDDLNSLRWEDFKDLDREYWEGRVEVSIGSEDARALMDM